MKRAVVRGGELFIQMDVLAGRIHDSDDGKTSMATEADMVNHPPHYKQHPSGVECIDITEHMSFNVGNAMKYLWRADHKNGIEDLRKAAWYVNREIEKQQKEQA